MADVQIYSASAGSGKTFMLVKEYLRILFEKAHAGNFHAFRNITAITFTTKATDEMKQRVIKTLKSIAAGEESKTMETLRNELPAISNLQGLAHRILKSLLRDFSSFNIQTIDSFFQDIIRSFARELGLPINYEVDLKSEAAIDYAVEELIGRIGFDEQVTNWLREYAFARMNDEKGWNFRSQLKEMSYELFDDNLDLEGLKPTASRIGEIRQRLNTLVHSWESAVSAAGRAIMQDIEIRGVPPEAYNKNWKSNIERAVHIRSGSYKSPSPTFLSQLSGESSPLLKSAPKDLKISQDAYRSEEYLTNSAILYQLYTEGSRKYLAADEARKNIYALGVIHQLNENLKKYRRENNILFLVDAARLISGFIALDDMPFLFEKIGGRIDHLFIDEFQDTSNRQWKNLLPLLKNILSSSSYKPAVLLVGDAKQSIYRWRGGDHRLISGQAAESMRPFETVVIPLPDNFRSLPGVVEFNNRFFESVVHLVDRYGNDALKREISSTYGHIRQKPAISQPAGKVTVASIGNEAMHWKEAALQQMDGHIRNLRESGYQYHEMAILVKTRQEGVEISRHLQRSGIDVLSAETLLLKFDPDVKLILAALTYLDAPDVNLNYVNLIWQYSRNKLNTDIEVSTVFTDFRERRLLQSWLPRLAEQTSELARLPCYQAFESVATLLGIDIAGNLFTAHLRQLLFDHFRRQSPALKDFLEWWLQNQDDLSISLESGTGRINIMTIHKAKGLEFPAVLIPYCEWNIFQNMNKDILWLSNDSIIKDCQLPYRAVLSLRETVFEEEFEKEYRERLIDSINVLYVAMTRAKENLYISIPMAKAEDGLPKKASGLVVGVLASWGLETNSEAVIIDSGSRDRPQDHKEVEHAESLWLAEAGKGGIPGITTGNGPYLQSSNRTREARIGNLVHAALFYAGLADSDEALKRASAYGHYKTDEEEAALNHLKQINTIPQFSQWIGQAQQIWNEQEIRFRDMTYRPDKVILVNGKYIVIDFKTGIDEEGKSAYREQVRSYMDAVSDVFPGSRVEGYILFTESASLMAVD